MDKNKRIVRLLVLGAVAMIGGLFTSGCESADPHESGLPWARPAQWEGGAPGLGGGGGLNQGRTGY